MGPKLQISTLCQLAMKSLYDILDTHVHMCFTHTHTPTDKYTLTRKVFMTDCAAISPEFSVVAESQSHVLTLFFRDQSPLLRPVLVNHRVISTYITVLMLRCNVNASNFTKIQRLTCHSKRPSTHTRYPRGCEPSPFVCDLWHVLSAPQSIQYTPPCYVTLTRQTFDRASSFQIEKNIFSGTYHAHVSDTVRVSSNKSIR